VFRKSSAKAIVYSTVALCDRQMGRQNCHNIAYMPDALAIMRRWLKNPLSGVSKYLSFINVLLLMKCSWRFGKLEFLT